MNCLHYLQASTVAQWLALPPHSKVPQLTKPCMLSLLMRGFSLEMLTFSHHAEMQLVMIHRDELLSFCGSLVIDWQPMLLREPLPPLLTV